MLIYNIAKYFPLEGVCIMSTFEEFMLQLKHNYLNENNGTVHYCSEKKIARKIKGPHTLVLIVGVEGAGKTTFCKKNFDQFNVISIDSFIAENFKTGVQEGLAHLSDEFIEHVKQSLQKGITVVDANSVMLNFRFWLLYQLQDYYTKVVLVVLNPPKTRLIYQIKQQLNLRMRPNMWKDVDDAYESLQQQLKNNIIHVGVNEVYIIK